MGVKLGRLGALTEAKMEEDVETVERASMMAPAVEVEAAVVADKDDESPRGEGAWDSDRGK